MIEHKTLCLDITITDVMKIYSPDINETVLGIFNDTWGHKCFNGMFIIKGTNINRMSSIVMDKKSLDGHAKVSVDIKCDVIVYNYGDIIVGKVIYIGNTGDIILQNEHAAINMKSSGLVVAKDDLIPVLVSKSTYPLNKNMISIIGVPFVPLYNNHKYLCVEGSDVEHIPIDHITSLLSKYNSKDIDKLKGILCPSRDSKEINLSKNPIKPGAIIYRDTRNFGELTYSVSKDDPVAELSPHEITERITAGYVADLWTIMVLLDNFDIDEIKKSNWLKFYNKFHSK